MLELPASSPDKQVPTTFLTVPGNWQSRNKEELAVGSMLVRGRVTLPLLRVMVPAWERGVGRNGGEKLFAADNFLAASVKVFTPNI